MLEIGSAIVTIVLLAALIIAVVKKIEVTPTLFLLGLVAFGFSVVFRGEGAVASGGAGAGWANIFEQFRLSMGDTLVGVGLIVLTVVAYSGYMSKIGASQALARVLVRPLSVVKSRVALLMLCMFVSYALMMVLPSAMGTFVICLGVILPCLLALGFNPLTVITALYLGCNVLVGPANVFAIMTLSFACPDVSAVDLYFRYTLPVTLPTIAVMALAHALWNLHLDKSEEPATLIDEYASGAAEVPCPKFYLLFPILPIVPLVAFSSLTNVGIVFSVVGGYIFALTIVFVIHMICSRDKLATYNGLMDFFNGMGPALTAPMMVIIMSFFFGSGLTALGGIDWMAHQVIDGLGLGFVETLIVLNVLFFVLTFLGSGAVAIPICVPVMVTCATAFGMTDLLPMAAVAFTCSGGLGMSVQLYEPKVLFISSICNVTPLQVVKRTVVPVLAGALVAIVLSVVLL